MYNIYLLLLLSMKRPIQKNNSIKKKKKAKLYC